jgi:hypothetical protein
VKPLREEPLGADAPAVLKMPLQALKRATLRTPQYTLLRLATVIQQQLFVSISGFAVTFCQKIDFCRNRFFSPETPKMHVAMMFGVKF